MFLAYSGIQDQVEDPELAAGEGKNFNHRNTLSISRIYPPPNLGGLKFESDADIG